MKPATVVIRQADLAAIHLLKKQLGQTDDEYRDLMATVCGGVRSAADLDAAGRARFRSHLEKCVKANGGHAAPARKRRPLRPHEAKLWSLWMQLADDGLVAQRTMKALNAWCKRMTGVDDIGFLNAPQQRLAIEGLKAWRKSRQEPQP